MVSLEIVRYVWGQLNFVSRLVLMPTSEIFSSKIEDEKQGR